MKTIKQILTQLQQENCFAYLGKDEFNLPDDAKEFLRQCIKKGHSYDEFIYTHDMSISLIWECDNLDNIHWNTYFEYVPGDIVICEISSEYIHVDDAKYGYIGRHKGYFSNSETYYCYDGEYYHKDALSHHNLIIDIHDDVRHLDDVCFCEDVQNYVLSVYCHYSEIDECDYYHSENMPEYENKKEHISGYHDSADVQDLSNTSLFKVGFEIEKTDFFGNQSKGDHIGDYEIFKGFEIDSSCGVEAITNILPLSHDSLIFETLCNNAAKVINSNFDNNCGGHINISCKHMTGSELYDSVKNYAGLFYAMYRFRLKNTYCNGDKSLKKTGGKYSAINQKYDCIEIRIPSAVKNVYQLIWRYKMTFQLMTAAYNKICFDQYLDNCQHLLKQVYTSKTELNKINRFAQLFQSYISFDIISEEIEEFINN